MRGRKGGERGEREEEGHCWGPPSPRPALGSALSRAMLESACALAV